MPELYRAFIYILIVSLPTLYVARLAMRSLVEPGELRLWLTAWLFGLFALLLSSSILIYSVLMLALSVYVHKTSKAPHDLFFVLLMSAPAVSENIGIPGLIGSLIELSPPRLFALAILLPIAIRLLRAPRGLSLSTADKLFWTFAALLCVLSLRHGSPTVTMRMVAMVATDVALPYYVFSRAPGSLADIRRSLFAFVFGAMPCAMIGALEFARGWRVYNSFVEHWGIVLVQPYLFRDGLLRASATAIEPIAFGFACMVALGFLLANREAVQRRLVLAAALGIVAIGLIAGLSRGPWLGAGVLLVVFVAAGRGGVRNLVLASLGSSLAFMLLLVTSFGERIVSLLPFVGTVEKSNEEYRGRLIDISMDILAQSPVFGSARYIEAPELVEMIQGQGIIDIVNTYVAVALEFGIVGLAIFVSIFATLAIQLARLSLRSSGSEGELARAMLGTLVAIVVTIGTVSSVSFIPYTYWAFAGLCTALLRVPAGATTHRTVVAPLPVLTVLGRPSPFQRSEPAS